MKGFSNAQNSIRIQPVCLRHGHHLADVVERVGSVSSYCRFGGIVDFDVDRLVIARQPTLANLFLGHAAERI